jgi:hypothetical protein
MSKFDCGFTEGGEQYRMDGLRVRNTNYNWGKNSSGDIYYATHFIFNEIQTHAFARGNSTSKEQRTVVKFERLGFDCETPDPSNPNNCPNPSNLENILLICDITEAGTLTVQKVITGEGLLIDVFAADPIGTDLAGPYRGGYNGLFILVSVADYPRGGGSFQLRYETV